MTTTQSSNYNHRMEYHSSWSAEVRDYFESVISAHGGWGAWDRFTSVEFGLRKFSGALVLAKGLHRTFFRPNKVIVLPKQRRVDFIYDKHVDSFENGKVTFSDSKRILEDGRTAFRKSTFEPWHPEHAAYFFGYAWANYISYPFILPQFEVLNFHQNPKFAFLDIQFPKDFHTHCQIQRFYFDQSYMLFRHDYRAPLAGPLVYGAHYTTNYVKHQGLQVSLIRKVRPRVGRVALPIYGIYAEIEF